MRAQAELMAGRLAEAEAALGRRMSIVEEALKELEPVFAGHVLGGGPAFGPARAFLVPPEGDAPDQKSWNPEWSRRGRGLAVYAAIRSLGRQALLR